jgi:DNA polymerase-4
MRTVVHWDGDRFFASIEQASDRRLRGRPVVVGGAQRGVVLSASAEARRLGIRPGWPTSRARRAVPALIVLPAHFDLYERFFDQILGLCRETTPLVEPSSVGSAWLDLTGTGRILNQRPEQVVAQFRSTVRDWLRLSISAGIATNKLVARIAARVHKPASQLTVAAGNERSFLAPLPLLWMPGMERQALQSLELAGIRSFAQFASAPIDALSVILGRNAQPLQRRAQGISEEPVGKKKATEPGWTERIDFAEDVWDEPFLLLTLRRMAEKLMAQVRASGNEIRRLTLELVYTDHDESRRNYDFPEPISLDTEAFPALPQLLETAWSRRVRLRALILKASRVYRPTAQLDLFTPATPRREYNAKLASTIDLLRRLHGPTVVIRGYELVSPACRPAPDKPATPNAA